MQATPSQDQLWDFIRRYMELTVEASAKDQKCHAVHMEIVAASGAFAQCGQKGNDDQNDNPDAENGPHGSVGG